MTTRGTMAVRAALPAFAFAISFAPPVFADDMQPAEAAAELFFARPFSAMSRTIAHGAIVYKGDKDLNDPDRAILSVAPSAADPCLFEALFVEAFSAGPGGPPNMNGAYVASIDLRQNIRASVGASSADAATLSVRGARLFCSRSVVFEPDLRMSYGEFCQDEITATSDTLGPRWRAAIDLLRKACRWDG